MDDLENFDDNDFVDSSDCYDDESDSNDDNNGNDESNIENFFFENDNESKEQNLNNENINFEQSKLNEKQNYEETQFRKEFYHKYPESKINNEILKKFYILNKYLKSDKCHYTIGPIEINGKNNESYAYFRKICTKNEEYIYLLIMFALLENIILDNNLVMLRNIIVNIKKILRKKEDLDYILQKYMLIYYTLQKKDIAYEIMYKLFNLDNQFRELIIQYLQYAIKNNEESSSKNYQKIDGMIKEDDYIIENIKKLFHVTIKVNENSNDSNLDLSKINIIKIKERYILGYTEEKYNSYYIILNDYLVIKENKEENEDEKEDDSDEKSESKNSIINENNDKYSIPANMSEIDSTNRLESTRYTLSEINNNDQNNNYLEVLTKKLEINKDINLTPLKKENNNIVYEYDIKKGQYDKEEIIIIFFEETKRNQSWIEEGTNNEDKIKENCELYLINNKIDFSYKYKI